MNTAFIWGKRGKVEQSYIRDKKILPCTTLWKMQNTYHFNWFMSMSKISPSVIYIQKLKHICAVVVCEIRFTDM